MVDSVIAPTGVAKVVQLGSDKVLIIEIKSDAPEGEYVIKSIEANPNAPSGATGDTCFIRTGVV
jgi:hypothetical protein